MTTNSTTISRSTKRALYSLAVAKFSVGTGALVIAGIVPEIATNLDVTTSAAGQLITIYALVYALSAPLIGIWASGFDKKRLLLVAASGFAISNFVALMAPSYSVLVFARVLSALSASAVTPVAAAVAAAIVPPNRSGSALGLVFGGIAVSTVLGVPVGAFLGNMFGWRATFALVVILGAIAAFAVLAFVPVGIRSPRMRFASLVAVLGDGPAMGAVSITALVMTSQFIPFSFVAVLFADALNATPGEVFWLLFSFGAASAAGNFAGGVLADRFTPHRTLLGALILLPFAIYAVSYLSMGFWTALAIMAAWGAVGFSFYAPQQARLIKLRPDQVTTLLALNASAIYVGTTLGSAIGGVLLTGTTATTLALVGSMAALIALVGYLFSNKHLLAEAKTRT